MGLQGEENKRDHKSGWHILCRDQLVLFKCKVAVSGDGFCQISFLNYYLCSGLLVNTPFFGMDV